MPELQLGYFDDDLRCDVIAQEGDHWAISSGGTGNWRSVGRFGLQPIDCDLRTLR